MRTALAINASAIVCAIIVLLAIDNFSPLARVDQFLQDWEMVSSFAAPMPQDPSIVIIAVDEDTLRQFPYRSPVDRKYVADLIRALERHGPAVIGVDLLFDQPTEEAKDAVLRRTLADAKVPLVVSYIPASAAVSPEQQAFEDAMVPAGTRGLADLPTDQFDTARSVYAGRTVAGRYVPGFARAVAQGAGIKTPAMDVPIIWRGRPAPTQVDPAPKPFRQFSALTAGFLPDAWLRGKIVLIGSDVTLVDRHRTPFSTILAGDSGQLPGVVIQAHSVSQLVHGTASPLTGWAADFAIAFVMALLGALLAAGNAALLLRVLGLGAALLLFWGLAIALFHFHGILTSLIAPPLAAVAAFATMDALSGRAARQQRKFIQGAFARYVSPKLVEQMMEDPSRMSLKGERRVMTYLFSDVQDFTTMSEKMESEDLARLVNGYLDGMTEIVLKHDGMVDKFIGDAVFAVFNAPLDLADHAQKAVRCMLEMDLFTEKFRAEQAILGIPLGVTRIGVHTGAAVIGNFGSQARFTYTAQGDAVNTASRLEGINKYFGTRLCVSDATRLLCRDIAFRPIASVVLKGKSQALDLWEPLQEGAVQPDFLAAYGAAYDRLRQGAPDAATMFSDLSARYPDDPCIRLHAGRLRDGAVGVTMVMTEK